MKIKVSSKLLSGCFLALGLSCGAKFEPFKEPMMAVAFSPDIEFEILDEASGKPDVLGKVKGAKPFKALGLAHVKIQGQTQAFLKIECPQEIKCDEGTGYLPPGRYRQGPLPEEIHIHETDSGMRTQVALLSPGDADAALAARNWLHKPGNTQPALEKKFITSTLDALELPARIQMMYEVYLFLKSFEAPDRHRFADPRIAPLVKKYRSLAELKKIFVDQEGRSWEVSPLFQWKVPTDVLPVLEKAIADHEKKTLAGFPLRSTSWKGLALEFNKENTPYLREKIFQKSLERATYMVDGPCPGDCNRAANISLSIEPLVGVTLQNGGQGVQITAMKAEAGEQGLVFKVSSADGEISFEPTAVPFYLATGGPGLRDLIAQIPDKWQDVLGRYSGFKRPALEFAMKFGKGGYDADSGLMKYTLSKMMYWPFFELFRQSPHVQKTGQGYTGTVDGFECNVSGHAQWAEECSWIQPKGSLNVRYRICYPSETAGKNCEKDFKEVVCAYNDSDIVEIGFHPEQILHDQPELQIRSVTSGTDGTDAEFCSAFFAAVAR